MSDFALYLPAPCAKPEAEIEMIAQRQVDRLDRAFLRSAMSQAEYDRLNKAIDDWARECAALLSEAGRRTRVMLNEAVKRDRALHRAR